MRIIPVIDVMGGVVVRAIAGRRSEYRPLVSKLTTSTEPLVVAEALLSVTGSKEIYVADLDAILGDEVPTFDPSRFPATVLLDAGVRNWDQLDVLKRWPNVRPVVGSETWTIPPSAWPKPFPAILSLDFFNGNLRTGWMNNESFAEIAEAEIATVIFLDLARVGLGQGTGMEKLISGVKRYFNVEIIAGGGVKNRDDLARLEEAGADAVLVASALHDGTLCRSEAR